MPKARLLCLALLLCLCGGSAFADFAASTSGQFYVGSTSLGSSTWGLSFQGTPSFSVTPTTTQVSLGNFNLSTALSYFDPFDFALSVNFVGGSGATFKADLSGLVTFLGGSATVNFDNTPHQFTFGADSFSLSITDVKVKNNSSASIMGTISNATFATTPEPAAIVLTSALFGAALILFRKRLRRC